MNVRLFVVYHRRLFDAMYVGLRDYRSHVTFFAVRPTSIRPGGRLRDCQVIYEHELPRYNPQLQLQNFRETSALSHVYTNGLHKGLDYVGFAQYDMAFGDSAFKAIDESLQAEQQTEQIFYAWSLPMSHPEVFGGIGFPIYEAMTESYNRHFGTCYNLADLSKETAPTAHLILLSTFVVSTRLFEQIMAWVSEFIAEIPRLHNGRRELPGFADIVERAYGLALASEVINGRATPVQIPIDHVWPDIRRRCDAPTLSRFLPILQRLPGSLRRLLKLPP